MLHASSLLRARVRSSCLPVSRTNHASRGLSHGTELQRVGVLNTNADPNASHHASPLAWLLALFTCATTCALWGLSLHASTHSGLAASEWQRFPSRPQDVVRSA